MDQTAIIIIIIIILLITIIIITIPFSYLRITPLNKHVAAISIIINIPFNNTTYLGDALARIPDEINF